MVCRAGSLPNVNQIGQTSNRQGIDLQTALNTLEDIKHGRDSRNGGRNVSPYRISSPYNSLGQSRHNTSRELQSEPKRVMSPHSVTYLSPPPDTNWRRTNSDSALHQSALMSNSQPLDVFHQNAIQIPRRSTVHDVDSNSMIVDDSQVIDSWDPGKQDRYRQYDRYLLNASLPENSRPKSCEVPGIMICPTQEDFGSINNHSQHIPISSNTGSLPDLTSLHFPAPLTTPIDVDDQNAGYQSCNSPYQSGPDSPYSPHSPHNNSNLSPPPPMAIQQINQNVLFQTHSGVVNCGVNDSNHRQMSPSPGPSPSPTSSRRRHHHNINNLVIGNPRHQHHSSGPHSPLQQTVGYSHTSSPPRITVEVRRQSNELTNSWKFPSVLHFFLNTCILWTPYFCCDLRSHPIFPFISFKCFDNCLEDLTQNPINILMKWLKWPLSSTLYS